MDQLHSLIQQQQSVQIESIGATCLGIVLFQHAAAVVVIHVTSFLFPIPLSVILA